MRAPRSPRGRQRMVPLRSAGRTAYRGREPPQRCQPQHDRPSRGSDKSAPAATFFIHKWRAAGAGWLLKKLMGWDPAHKVAGVLFVQNRFRSRNLSANQPRFLRNGTAAMHKALYGTAAKLKELPFADDAR
jgi:hypothetical protein